MNRRSLLKFLGLAPVAVAAAPSALASAGLGSVGAGAALAAGAIGSITPQFEGSSLTPAVGDVVTRKAAIFAKIAKISLKTGKSHAEIRSMMEELELMERFNTDWVAPEIEAMKSWTRTYKNSATRQLTIRSVRRIVCLKEQLGRDHYNDDDFLFD